MTESLLNTTKDFSITYDDLSIVEKTIGWAVQHQYSFAFWKLPKKNTRHLVIDTSSDRSKCIKPEIEFLNPGFIFSPFDNDDNNKCIFIESNIHLEISYLEENAKLLHNFSTSEVGKKLLDLHVYLKEDARQSGSIAFYIQQADYSEASCSKDHFTDMVREAIEQIEIGKFEKIVPARTKEITLSPEHNLIDSFWEMTRNYPNSFISLVGSPLTGTWLGATPEILISVENKKTFNTTSLAATQKYMGQEDLKEVTWTQKEIEEQALVSRYIINCFKKIRLREFEEHGPKTIQAGNLLHLKTDFSVDMIARDFPLLGTVMLQLLHPTSAICGMPKNESLDFLRRKEMFNRQFFGGFLGPVNMDDLTALYVNLRCGQLQEGKMVLYSGAGVTIDSSQEKEWVETEVKCDTLETFLRKES